MRFILLAFVFLFGCTQSSNLSRTQVIMGTFCTITLDNAHSQQIENGFYHLAHMEQVLSSYQENALIYQLNKQRSVPSNAHLKDVLEKSKHYHQFTKGYFDITIGSITKELYRFGEEERIPTKEELTKVTLGVDQVVMDEKTISLKGDIRLDLGGIGKGYALDSLSDYYHKQGITSGQISLSGDIRCLDTCKVHIQDPFKEEGTLGVIQAKINNLSISTSGTYRRYVKDKAHHHLINPKTKTQGKDFVSVTIVSKNNNTLTDVIATAISTMPKDLALTFVRNQETFGYLLVTPKGEKIAGNLEKFVHLDHSPQTIKHKK